MIFCFLFLFFLCFRVYREKDNKAQAIKLLKAVQGRLAKGDASNGLGGALADLGGESDVLVSVAPSKVLVEIFLSFVSLLRVRVVWVTALLASPEEVHSPGEKKRVSFSLARLQKTA